MRLIKALIVVGGFVASMGANALGDDGLESGISRLPEKKQAMMEIVMDREGVIQQILSRPFLPSEGPLSDFEELENILRTVSDDRLVDALLAEDTAALQAVLVDSPLAFQADMVGPQFLGSITSDLVFNPVDPCRIFDSRFDSRGLMVVGSARDFAVSGSVISNQGGNVSDCPGVPTDPVAIVFNLAAADPQGNGNVRVWASGDPLPLIANLNFRTGVNISNTTVAPVCQACAGAQMDVRVLVSISQAQVVGDIIGYFNPPEGCPAGTTEFNGHCFESALRTADDFVDALEICGDAGGRLPSVGELWRALSVLVGNNTTGEHTDDTHADSGSTIFRNTRVRDDPSGPILTNPTSILSPLAPYRCVIPLFNFN